MNLKADYVHPLLALLVCINQQTDASVLA